MTRFAALAQRVRGVGLYATAVALCVGITIGALRLWRADLTVPFGYGGDGLYYQVLVKTTLEQGWYFTNPNLGLPGGGQMYDFPAADGLHFLIIKLLAWTGLGSGALVNLYLLLTYPLTTLSTLFVLRHFRVSAAPALVASLLYTFLPYHLLRGTGHLCLSAYYLVPFMVMVILWLYQEPSLLFGPKAGSRWPRLRLSAPKSLASLLICALVSSAGVYYAFFGCFFLVVAGLASWLRQRRLHVPLATGALIAVILAGVLANVGPGLVYGWRHGKNVLMARHHYVSAEVYGLKVAQLLLPLSHHRWSVLANVRERYDEQQEPNEAKSAALGTLGTVGFLLLLARFFYRRPAAAPDPVDGLALLNTAAVVLATVGGLGSLFALLVDPSIRGYNRISVYIAFFCLFGLVLLLEKVWQRTTASRSGRTLAYGLCAALLALGVLDQTNDDMVINYAEVKATYAGDAEFVQGIEATRPPGSAVFQLPVIPFPEGHGWYPEYTYDLFRGYLHSHSLRWSFGAMRGRETSAWQESVGAKPVDELLPTVALAGFDGLWVDRKGYKDGGVEIEGCLRRLLGSESLRSRDGRLLFFDLREYGKSLSQRYRHEEWDWRRDTAGSPLAFTWREGFGLEGDAAGERSRWCFSPRGELWITNPSPHVRTVSVRMGLGGTGTGPARLRIDGPLWEEEATVAAGEVTEVARTVTVPPGKHLLRFTSEARPYSVKYFPHSLYFRVRNFSAHELLSADEPGVMQDCVQVFQGIVR